MGNYKNTKKYYIEFDKKCNKSFSYDENYYTEKCDDKQCCNKYKEDYCYMYKCPKDIYCNDYYCKDKYPDDKCCNDDKCDHDNKKCEKTDSFPSDCCTDSIREALEIIKEFVNSLGNSSTLDVVIYTIDGSTSTVTFKSSKRCSVEITDNAIIYNCVAIALNSISKIEILSSSLTESVRNRLLDRLRRLSESCENPYLAYDLDDEYYCPKCKKEKCNCKCDNTLGDYVVDNVDELSGVGRMGNSRPVFAISEVNTTLVVNDVTPILDTETVLQSADLDVSLASVVDNLTTISSGVVNNITTNNQQVVRDIVSNSSRILTASFANNVTVVESVSPFTTFAVQSVTTTSKNINVAKNYSTEQVVRDITKSSAVATNIVDYDTTHLVNEITTSEVQVVQSITEEPVNVIGSVSATTLPGVSDVTYVSKNVINSITPVREIVSIASDPSFANAITRIQPTTITINQDVSISTAQAVTDVPYTPINVVSDITTTKMQVVDSVTLSAGQAMENLTFETIPFVDDINSNNALVVSSVTFNSSDVLLSSENHTAINSVLNNIDMDNNIQEPRAVSVGNCLGEGALEVIAENVPVSIVKFTTNLTNKLNCMIKDINQILNKCCCEKKDDCNDKCSCYDECDCNKGRYEDKQYYCPSIPYFKVSDLLEDVYFDLNADVTINSKPVISRCVNISVFDESSDSYLHNINEGYLSDGVLAGFSEDEHENVVGNLNVSLVDVVESVTYTTKDAVSSITFTNTDVVKDIDFNTQVVNQLANFTTEDVIRSINPQRSNFVNSVSLVRPVDVVSSITTFTDSFVSELDTDSTRIVTDITSGTTAVVSSVSTIGEVYVNSVTTTPQSVLKDITATPVNVVRDVLYDTEEGVTNLETRDQRFLTDVTPSYVSAVSNLTLSSANVINSISVSGVQAVYDVNPRMAGVTRLDNIRPTTVVTNVTSVPQTITTINTISTGRVSSVGTISKVDVVKDVELVDTDTAQVVSDVTVDTSRVAVVKDIDGDDVDVLAGDSREAISPVSASAGNGLLISEDEDGNITIYSLCKLQSVEIDSEECK